MKKYTVLLQVLYISGIICSTTTFKVKRQTCQDGTYIRGEKECCQCATGQYLVQDCDKSMDDRTCEYCKQGSTYNSNPNSLYSCEPCRSCDHAANMEVVDHCTIGQNTECQCQKGYFCEKPIEQCTFCLPCTICGDEGIKVECTATKNTECKEAKETGTEPWVIGTVVAVTVLVVVICAVIVFLFRRKLSGLIGPRGCFEPTNIEQEPEENNQDVLLPINFDLRPHISDIAEVVGWLDMKKVAEKSGICDTKIQAHQLNHPSNAEEQCNSLLKDCVEKMGMNKASRELIRILQQMNKNDKAERIRDILNRAIVSSVEPQT
ncbi:hypothetical protein UPYG_G00081480 [Umbra pygmaea]|uniref:Tumor necrosis factor receptor superfamily member 6 n=1 Tax=Umbra pygmaea TaxID=75934 RepID=A0ABD0Y170_UMBPY